MGQRTVAHSPLTIAPTLVDFPDAIRAVIDGKSITKQEWDDPTVYGKVLDGKLKIFLDDKRWHPWILNDGDLTGDDWIVLSE